MRRYKETSTKKDKSGKTVYTTTYYPTIPIEDNDQFILSKDGDRLDSLAFRYFGDTNLWWIISKANGIKGGIGIEAGTLLRIPSNIPKCIIWWNIRWWFWWRRLSWRWWWLLRSNYD